MNDDLHPARGCLIGTLIGVLIWVAFGLAVWWVLTS